MNNMFYYCKQSLLYVRKVNHKKKAYQTNLRAIEIQKMNIQTNKSKLFRVRGNYLFKRDDNYPIAFVRTY